MLIGRKREIELLQATMQSENHILWRYMEGDV